MKVTGFSRTAKDLAIREMEKEVKEHTAFFIARHEGGVSAFSLDKLRAKLRPHSRYLVVKNSLARRVLSQARLTLLAESLNGTCGMTLTQGDPVAPCRILVDFAKENQNFKIQGAYVNGSVLLPDEIRVLAALPPREVLLAKAVGSIQAPLSRLAGVLSGALRKLVTALDAIAKKKTNG